MYIDRLATDNLREGIFCAAEKPDGKEMYDQLEVWLESNALRGLIARDDTGEVAGFVLYYPIERAPLDVDGEGLYMVQCLYVKPKYQGSGVGRLLIESAIADARSQGASGLAVEGYGRRTPSGTDFMPGAFFRHMGMVQGESRDQGTLYYVSFNETAAQPRYLTPNFQPRSETPRVKIDILDCRRCYVGISNRKVVDAVLEKVGKEEFDVTVHDQNTREAIKDKGMSSGIFVNGMLTFLNGPVSEEDMLSALAAAMSAHDQAMDR